VSGASFASAPRNVRQKSKTWGDGMIHKQIIADIIAEIEAAKNYQAGICHEDAKAAKGAYEHALRIIKQRLNWTEQDEINSRQASVSPMPAAQVRPPLVRLCPKCGSDVEFSADDETALCENCGAILNVDLENDYEISVIA